MNEANLVGNIFLLDKHIDKKQIIISLAITFFIAISKFLLESENILKNLTIKEFMYPLLGIAMVYTLINIKVIYALYKKYFTFNFTLMVPILFELALVIPLVYISKGILYSWILAIFWLFSGFLRVMIQFSKAIFAMDVGEYLKIIQIFAYSRAAYFAIVIIWISTLVKIEFWAFYFIFFGPVFLVDLIFIANLFPYMTKHKNVRYAIKLIRIVKDQKRIKINQLKNLTDFPEDYFNTILNRLAYGKFLKIENKRVELSEGYKSICKTN